MKKHKKRAFTLLEIMIVIFLIGIIGSVIGINMKGSMDKGKAFKTEQAMKQIHDILLVEADMRSVPLSEVADHPEQYLEDSGLVRNAADLVKDGWGNPFDISFNADKNDLDIVSQRYNDYLAKQKKT